KSSISCCEGCLRRPNLGLVYSFSREEPSQEGPSPLWIFGNLVFRFAELLKCPPKIAQFVLCQPASYSRPRWPRHTRGGRERANTHHLAATTTDRGGSTRAPRCLP
ncbi:unnamed protein product, partial [Ectocarpus sp. 12 AP-2014]